MIFVRALVVCDILFQGKVATMFFFFFFFFYDFIYHVF